MNQRRRSVNDGPRRDGLPDAAAAMLVRASVARPELASTALANEAVRGLLADFPGIYTEAGLRQPARAGGVRARHGHRPCRRGAGDRPAEALGQFLGFRPLRPDDPVDPFYVLYVFESDCPYNRRVRQRKSMKRRLAKAYRRWVNEAYRSTRRDFLAKLPEGAAAAIRKALGLDPIGFWRTAKGTLDLHLPAPPVQLTMFDGPEDAIAPRWRK